MSQNREIATILHDPMKFFDLYEDICVELPVSVPINIIKLELNKIIRRVNDEVGLHKELIKISTGSINNSIEELTTTAIESETSANIEDMGRFSFGWDWNTTDNRLRLSDDIFEVLDIYIDEEEWKQVDYETVKSSDNTSEKYWSQVGRYIWFPLDVADETTTLRISCKRKYSSIDVVVDADANIDLPRNYRQLLISGVLYNLTARPKYKDENIFAVNKQTFESEMQSLKTSYYNLESTYESRDLTYKY